MGAEEYTINKITVKRIFELKFFGIEITIKIPVPLWYPKWKHKSEWTLQ